MFLRAVIGPGLQPRQRHQPRGRAGDGLHPAVDDGLAQLRRAFPVSFPSIGDFNVDLPSDYPDSSATGYARIHTDYIDPIERSYGLSLRITTAIANEFGAHGQLPPWGVLRSSMRVPQTVVHP
jgi:phosphoenolpyruvate carboxylase